MNSKELLSNGPNASYIGLSIIKLVGTEYTFQCECYFPFACPGNFDKVIRVILLDTVPYMGQCPAESPFWLVFQVFKFFDFP